MSTGRPSAGVLSLLRQNAAFRALWLSRAISFFGDSLGDIALLLFVAGDAGTGTAVALLLLVGDFTPTLLSPFSGTLSDRLDRKRLMIGCELSQGAIITAIALVGMPLPMILGLVAFRSLLASLFQPASRSAVTALVANRDLENANAALGFGTHGFELVGPLVGTAVLPLVGVRGMLLADAVTFLASALLLVRLPTLPRASTGDAATGSFLREAAAGLGYIWRIRPLRILTAGFGAVVAFAASDDVALVFLAQGPLGGSEATTSLIYAGAGTGLLAGFLLVAGYGSRAPAMLLFLLGFGVSSAGNLFTGLSWAIPVAFAMQVVRGVGISMIDVGTNTFVQRIVPPGMQGRVFANLYGAIGLAAGLSYAVGGPLLDATGPRVVLAIAGLGGLAATAAMWLALPGVMRSDDPGTPHRASEPAQPT
jgi:MFS family permease